MYRKIALSTLVLVLCGAAVCWGMEKGPTKFEFSSNTRGFSHKLTSVHALTKAVCFHKLKAVRERMLVGLLCMYKINKKQTKKLFRTTAAREKIVFRS